MATGSCDPVSRRLPRQHVPTTSAISPFGGGRDGAQRNRVLHTEKGRAMRLLRNTTLMGSLGRKTENPHSKRCSCLFGENDLWLCDAIIRTRARGRGSEAVTQQKFIGVAGRPHRNHSGTLTLPFKLEIALCMTLVA